MMLINCWLVVALLLLLSSYPEVALCKRQRGSHALWISGGLSDETAESAKDGTANPYLEIGGFLTRFGRGTDFERYSLIEVSNAIEMLARSEAAVKSMDGATHQFRNAFKESSSLSLRFGHYMRAKRKKLKEAAKIREYTETVERSLQAAEILQAMAVSDPQRRERFLKEAHLVEVRRFVLSLNTSRVACLVSVMVPMVEANHSCDAHVNVSDSVPLSRVGAKALRMQLRKAQSTPVRFLSNELIVAVTDDCSDRSASIGIARLLRLLSRDGEVVVSLKARRPEAKHDDLRPSDETGSDVLLMQPSLLSLACELIGRLRDIFPPSDASAVHSEEESDSVNRTEHRRSMQGLLEEELSIRRPSSIRIIGRSVGGAVGALASVLLDGAMVAGDASIDVMDKESPGAAERDSDQSRQPHVDNTTASAAARLLNSEDVRPWMGAFRDRVQCIAIGPPPCISRSAAVPRYIRSIVCGDDVVPRAHPLAVQAFRGRVLTALKKGAGKRRGALGYLMGTTGLLTDLSSVAGQSFAQYRDRKAPAEHSSGLMLPGRVFFVKSRQLKQGATIQRVYRGNWQEDVLWRLRDILISKRMIEHHQLEAYIRALSRC